MSDYTPETAEIRAAWLDSHRVDAEGGGFEREGRPLERLREFDRWFASEIEKAELRARRGFADELTRKGVYSFDIHSIRRYAGENHREQ